MAASVPAPPVPPRGRSAPSPLAVLLGLQPSDGKRTTAITGLHFILGATIVFMLTAAFGLFVAEFGSQRLPYAYLAIAVLITGLNLLYLRLSNRFPFVRLSQIVLAFLTVVCLLLWLGLASPIRPAVIFLLPAAFQFVVNVTVLVVWPLAGRAFDLREAKRTFGVIAGGDWIASLLVGVAVAPLLALLGTDNLLLLAAASAGLALLVFRLIARLAGVTDPVRAPAATPTEPARAADPVPLRSLLASPIVPALLAYIVLLWIIYYFVDNIMWANAAVRYPDADQLSAFTGRVVSMYGTLAAVMSIFLTGRILARYGVRNALLVLPVLLTANMAALALAGTFGLPTIVPFVLATVAKMLVVGLGFSLASTAMTCLYQPLPPALRGRTQAFAEGVLQSLAIGLAGVLLLLLGVLRVSAVGLAWAVAAAGVAWIASVLAVGRQYPRAVAEALARRRLGEGMGVPMDRDTLALLRGRLRDPAGGAPDPAPGVVLYALATLEREDPAGWPGTLAEALPALLAHPSAEVRAEALNAVARLPAPTAEPLDAADVVSALVAHVRGETEPAVCAAGVAALAALRGEAAAPFLAGFIGDEPLAETAALVALRRLPASAESARADARLDELIASPEAGRREQAAAVCRSSGRAEDGARLARLLVDAIPGVRRAALGAAPAVPGLDLAPVVAAAGQPATTLAAEHALAEAGEAALPAIAVALDEPPTSADAARLQQLALARALGRTPGAVPLLLRLAAAVDAEVRTAALQGLAAQGYRTPGVDLPLLDREVRHGGLLAAAALAARPPGDAVLQPALTGELKAVRERILLILQFGLDAAALRPAAEALGGGDDSRIAYALETVEMQLPAGLRPRVMPLVELPEPAALAARLQAAGVDVPRWTEETALLELAAAGDRAGFAPWTQAAAIYTAAGRCPDVLPGPPSDAAARPALVEEMLAWAARGAAGPEDGAGAMLSTVEKVLVLKRAGMFRETPDAVLADAAALCEEVHLAAGEQVIAKGDPGDSLYIVVEGRLRVHDGGRVLNDLAPGDMFGELALLDPAPRMASVDALEAGIVLRLGQEPFEELIRRRPEVALGVMRVVTRWLRARTADLAGLDAELRGVRGAAA